MKKFRVLFTVTAAAAMAFSLFSGIDMTEVKASDAPQTLPFSQNWVNTGLITTNNDWSGVAGIVGYRGDDLITATGVDPSTILGDGSGTPVNVIANQSTPNTLATGGIAEFEITDPVIALQGSGTADAPHIVIHVNTTGQNNVRFQCTLRDLDTNADDAVQPVAIQYRVGGTGNYTNVPGGFFADVTISGPLEHSTPVDLPLPSDASNQPLVEIRVMTTNAVGSDEWVGIDDISVSAMEAPPVGKGFVDFDGDGKTDYSVVRETDSGSEQVTWFNRINGGGDVAFAWGRTGDSFIPGDYDGDEMDDLAVYRPGESVFYIFQSSTNSFRMEQFGIDGDISLPASDFDGDGKDDIAVFRPGTGQSTWFYRLEADGPTYYVPWGQSGDIPYVGDFDMDGKTDTVVKRNNGGLAEFWVKFSSLNSYLSVPFGFFTDKVLAADFDGDAVTDLTLIRSEGGKLVWYTSAAGQLTITTFGSDSDIPVAGDYDGDGRADIAVWRAGSPGQFWIYRSSDSSVAVMLWGQTGDIPVAAHGAY